MISDPNELMLEREPSFKELVEAYLQLKKKIESFEFEEAQLDGNYLRIYNQYAKPIINIDAVKEIHKVHKAVLDHKESKNQSKKQLEQLQARIEPYLEAIGTMTMIYDYEGSSYYFSIRSGRFVVSTAAPLAAHLAQ
jgi:hypothetical protein